MKTLEQQLEKLPEVYKELVIENMKRSGYWEEDSTLLTISLTNALSFAFTWKDSEEGADFWVGIYEECKYKNL
jgi:hypothetical protein